MRPVVVCVQSVGLAALVGVGAPALAQEVSGPAGDDRIVITATRQAEDASDIPQSIVVLSGDQLAGADGAEDVVQRLVGVQAAISNGSQTTFQIRGVGAVDHQALTPSAAAVHVDGVFLATNVQASLLAYDLDRVEVLKGPQGHDPGPQRLQRLHQLHHGAADRCIRSLRRSLLWQFRPPRRAQAAASGPIGEGARGRIAVRALNRDLRIENVGGPDDAGGVRDEFGVRGALALDLSPDVELLLRGHVEQDQGVNPAPLNSTLALGDHQISVGADGVQDTNNRFYGASAELTANAGDWRITSLTSFEGFGQDYGFDFDGQPAAIANLSYDRAYWQVAQELYGRTSWDGGDLLIGLSLSSDDFKQDYLIWCGSAEPDHAGRKLCQYPAAAARVGPTPASTAPAVSLLTRMRRRARWRRSTASSISTWSADNAHARRPLHDGKHRR
jgi:iron complex outermembrane receptor protein